MLYDKFLDYIKFLIQGKCSILAINVDTNEIIGIVIMYPMFKKNFTWEYLIMKKFNNEILDEYFNLMYKLVNIKLELKEEFNLTETLHYFFVAVSEEYKNKNEHEKLLLIANKMGQSIGIPTISRICFSKNDQERCRRIGMKVSFMI